ncbi:hypothetical protein J6590_046009 [Homalodisca vitripennis]|nr:hypothetical protein J6590_046009 [Homalodisca vitripennis]
MGRQSANVASSSWTADHLWCGALADHAGVSVSQRTLHHLPGLLTTSGAVHWQTTQVSASVSEPDHLWGGALADHAGVSVSQRTLHHLPEQLTTFGVVHWQTTQVSASVSERCIIFLNSSPPLGRCTGRPRKCQRQSANVASSSRTADHLWCGALADHPGVSVSQRTLHHLPEQLTTSGAVHWQTTQVSASVSKRCIIFLNS